MHLGLKQLWDKNVGIRITEESSLHGLLIRERGELIEYVSYGEARLRVERGMVPVMRPSSM